MAAGYTDVLFRTDRGLGWITLNRPKAINALDHEMVRRIDGQLATWASDDQVGGVVLTGAGERGLCAGGDIVSIYHDARADCRTSVEFWRDEYVMNARIASYPKPYLAVMTGIVMGGGVGVSAHGSIRLVTDTTRIAMPETGIGFCPDVGGTWLLSQAPGEIGTHLALTGDQFGAGDAITCGLADHYLGTDRVAAFLSQLSAENISAAAALTEDLPASCLKTERDWIDTCYSAGTVPEVLSRLRSRPELAAQRSADLIAEKSPIAVSVALRALRQARQLPTLQHVLDQDLRIAFAALGSHDLVEGIRAQVIEKDRTPDWSPPTLADVTPAMIDRYFAPLPYGVDAVPTPQEVPS
jgi:enoyl-CoA hydratase